MYQNKTVIRASTVTMMPSYRRNHAMIRCCLFLCTTMVRRFVVTAAKDTPKRKFIGANWKCNLETVHDVDHLVSDMNRKYNLLSKKEQQNVELCVLVPYVFMDRVRQKLNPQHPFSPIRHSNTKILAPYLRTCYKPLDVIGFY
jgi:hypothetical protein